MANQYCVRRIESPTRSHPPLVGLCAALVRRADSVGTYFGIATLIGAMSVFCGYELSLLSHLDCGDHCAAEVPSYTALRWVAWVAAVPAVLAPAALALVSTISGRRRSGTSP